MPGRGRSRNEVPGPDIFRAMTARAVLLLSGGLDSTTLLALALREGREVHALTFRYGQRHSHEIEAARRVGRAMGVAQHIVADIDLRMFGGSALTADVEVPKDRPIDAMAGEIPVTYVPARNTIFLSLALAWAEVREARAIFIGANAVDYSGYPDCRPEFLAAYETMANLATKAGVEGRRTAIRAPLVLWPKERIVREGVALGVDFRETVSCYQATADGLACGRCDACRIRRTGFERAGLPDLTRYIA